MLVKKKGARQKSIETTHHSTNQHSTTTMSSIQPTINNTVSNAVVSSDLRPSSMNGTQCLFILFCFILLINKQTLAFPIYYPPLTTTVFTASEPSPSSSKMKAASSARRLELQEIPGGNTGQKVKEIESKLSSSASDDGAKSDKGKFICLVLY